MRRTSSFIVVGLILMGLLGAGCSRAAGASGVSGLAEAATPAATATSASGNSSSQAANENGAWLGISVAQLNAQMAKRLGSNVDTGVAIVLVLPNSPAATAGLKRGDLVKTVNGQGVTTPEDVTKEVAKAKPGDKVNLTIERSQTEQTISVTAGTRSVLKKPAFQPKSLPPELKGLEGLPPNQWLGNVQGWSVTVKDKDGKSLTIAGVPGKVSAVSATSVTIEPNDPKANGGPYDVNSNTVVRTAKGTTIDAVKAGDQVTIVTVDSSTHATAIIGMRGKLGEFIGPKHLPLFDKAAPNLKDKFKEKLLPLFKGGANGTTG